MNMSLNSVEHELHIAKISFLESLTFFQDTLQVTRGTAPQRLLRLLSENILTQIPGRLGKSVITGRR